MSYWYIVVNHSDEFGTEDHGLYESEDAAMSKAQELMDEFADDGQEYERDNVFGEAEEKYAVMGQEEEGVKPANFKPEIKIKKFDQIRE